MAIYDYPIHLQLSEHLEGRGRDISGFYRKAHTAQHRVDSAQAILY